MAKSPQGKDTLLVPPLPPKKSLSLRQLGIWPGRKSLAHQIGCTGGLPSWWCYTGGVPWLSEPFHVEWWQHQPCLFPFLFMCIFKKDMERWRCFFSKWSIAHPGNFWKPNQFFWKLQFPVCFVHDARTLLDILGQSAWKHIHNPRHVFGRRTHTIAASQALLDGHGILKAMDKFNLSKPTPNQEHTWDACTSKNIS